MSRNQVWLWVCSPESIGFSWERVNIHKTPCTEWMTRRRIACIRERVKSRLLKAFVDEHTEHEVAFSFSLGVFITALPSMGTGILVFLILSYLSDRLSKIAMFASIVILNPIVKWGVYGASYSLGRLFLGPVSGVSFDGVTLSAGPDILIRLWLGNLILAVIFAIAAYIVGLRIVTEFQKRAQNGELPILDLSTKSTSVED